MHTSMTILAVERVLGASVPLLWMVCLKWNHLYKIHALHFKNL